MVSRSCHRIFRELWIECKQPLSFRRLQGAHTSKRSHRGVKAFYRGLCISKASMVKIPDSEWKTKLTPEQYSVCREKGTEPPWSGEYVDFKGKGTYQCVCCGSDLFRSLSLAASAARPLRQPNSDIYFTPGHSSSAKFDSGTGWPSFHSVIEISSDRATPQLSVVQKHDDSHGMVRVEVLCQQCDSHLGHVFPDGPPPTGLRYCINSISLQFQSAHKDS